MNDYTKHCLVMQTTFMSAFLYTSFHVDPGIMISLVGGSALVFESEAPVGPLMKRSVWWH